jgi:hypothetical protein
MYTLGTAARATGMAKSTIHRAIKRGIVSARSTMDGRGYEIDPAELHRVYPPLALNGSAGEGIERCATPPLNAELEIRLARAEAELQALRQLLESERRRSEELRVERADWKAQAERLALAAPAGKAARPWWPWRRGA